MAYGLPRIEEKLEICEGCARRKQHQKLFTKRVASRAKEILNKFFCKPMRTASHEDNNNK